jgi:hypothetical protein
MAGMDADWPSKPFGGPDQAAFTPDGRGIVFSTRDVGVSHFHALRHGFATALSHSVKNVKTTQTLMRHSDPRLTLNIYTHGVMEHERAAIDNLPDLTQSPETQTMKKTGTDDNTNALVHALDQSMSKPLKTTHESAQMVIP